MTKSATDRPVVGACEGCGKTLHGSGEEYWNGADYAEIPIAPGVAARVCAKDLGRDGAPSRMVKGACARRARQKRALCPGCGAKEHADTTWRGVLCDKCVGTLARVRGSEAKTVQWHVVLSAGILPYNGDSAKRLQVARDLAEAVAGGRRWEKNCGEIYAPERIAAPQHRAGSALAADPIVELDAAQAEALCRFLGAVRAVLDEQREEGRREGDDLLHRLARGEVSPADYEEQRPKARKRG